MKRKGNTNCFRILLIIGVIFITASSSLYSQFTVYGIAEKGKKKKHGKVITYEPMKSVVMDCQGDTLTFDLNEYEFRFTTRRPPKPYIFPDGEKYHRIGLGVLPGSPSDGGYINYSYHVQKTRRVGYGGGLAFENYGDADGFDFLTPYAVFYSYLLPQNTTPFLRASAGYGIAIKNAGKDQVKAVGGLNLSAALGVRLSTNRVMIDFAVGARFQRGYYEFDNGEFFKTSERKFRRLDFTVGFMW